ncbi:MAG: DUF3000 domain-containing protein [Microbacterium ginsengisoli]|uniref:DUF3000 family protein n=1 Tax=Microbacterium TaxID=33882 RepID=UPI0007012745|nr:MULTISPECIES: DUF3000 family protein [unclassified Microbacterium]KQR93091.1 hypothetical protein ASG00_02400 [Microbacterium sp. Leaf351]KQS05525.1 hypothetical protein ASF93_00825 [Microbacterium sp. Leaf347]MBN9197394.1 DUF3000 domain-containing protein [Microbacterium ginsengisoli]OJU77309.1 MAG: hypothetical protein BGO15_07545 [Microbacterium sp. 71-23]
MVDQAPAASASFAAALAQLHAADLRDDLVTRELPAPTGLAPEAFALAGDIRPEPDALDSVYGTGRFVLLHDREEPDAWGGAWRIVCYAQAPLEVDIGVDPMVAEVAWAWLLDALDENGAAYHSPSGTVTKTVSQGFGSLAAEGSGSQLELRASWTPDGPFDAHVRAWAEVVCMLAGLPPGSEQAPVLNPRGRARA